jgi:transposase InsO family protein
MMMNHKKLRRLYREERLQVRHRGGRKRALGMRAPIVAPQAPNQRWSLDLMSDAFFDGRRFLILSCSTTLRGNAWHSSLTRRCPTCRSCASSTA